MIWRIDIARSKLGLIQSLVGTIILLGFFGLAWGEKQIAGSPGESSPALDIQPAMEKILTATTQDLEKELTSL
ncbi:MAG: hypothetical protein PHW74_14650, partial [Desulfobacca sp.]|nr:hypothetical protein [Desulfobacca sp.]